MSNKKKVFHNFSWIFIGKMAQSLLALVIGSLTARYLGSSDYGVINYAATWVGIVLPLAQVGQSAVLVQEIVDKPEDESAIVGSSCFVGLISSMLCYLLILLTVCIANNDEPATVICCAIYGFSLFFQATQLITYWFQAKLLAKYISIISLIAYFVVSIYKALLLALKVSIYYFAFSYSIDYLVITVLAFIAYRKLTNSSPRVSIPIAARLVRRGKYFIIPGMLMSLLGYIDRIMLKNIVDNSSTGLYSAASVCANLTGFVFIAIIDTMRPVILDKKKISDEKFDSAVKGLYSLVIYMGIFVCIFTMLFSKILIYLLCGSDYMDAVPALRVVVWHTILSFVGSVRDIWILGYDKQKYLAPINLVGVSSNVILNYFFIRWFGIVGAAAASVISLVIMYFAMGVVIRDIVPCTKIMIKSLNPRVFIEMVRMIVGKGRINERN